MSYPDFLTRLILYLLRFSYTYFIAGMDQANSYALLVHKLCEAFQRCIHPHRIFITLHANSSSLSSSFKSSSRPTVNYTNHNTNNNNAIQSNENLQLSTHLLQQLDIPNIDYWYGNFTSNYKMVRYLQIMHSFHDPNTFLYHSDLDEFPDPDEFQLALKEIESGQCDAIRGVWVDRAAIDGSLNNVRIDTKLEDQFPMKCKFSSNFMPGKMVHMISVLH